MPDHVINEVIFRGVSTEKQKEIISKVCNEKREIDFEILLPIPLNVWRGGVGAVHQKTFPDNALDWCTKNWSTKWGAYGQSEKSIIQEGDALIFRFRTAWRAPYGWLLALFHTVKTDFESNHLSEGEEKGKTDSWNWNAYESEGYGAKGWDSKECDESLHRHLHKLLWGVEQFEEENAS